MTSNDELHRMLDERGIKWWEGDDERKTLWESNGLTWEYFNDENGDAWLGFLGACEQDITPEQAIAATLGKEPDDAATSKLHDRMNATLLEYERTLGSEKADGAITVPFVVEMHQLLEEAATFGGGYQGFWTHDGTLHIELSKLPESISVRLPDKRDREVRSARVWQYTLGDADATPTRQSVGTCHDRGNIERFICSECGCRLDLQDDDWEATMWLDDGAATVPRFCPNCGKKVVE